MTRSSSSPCRLPPQRARGLFDKKIWLLCCCGRFQFLFTMNTTRRKTENRLSCLGPHLLYQLQSTNGESIPTTGKTPALHVLVPRSLARNACLRPPPQPSVLASVTAGFAAAAGSSGGGVPRTHQQAAVLRSTRRLVCTLYAVAVSTLLDRDWRVFRKAHAYYERPIEKTAAC